jgi:hypothetical protein
MCLRDCIPSPQVQSLLSVILILCKYWFRPILPIWSCINTELCAFCKPRYSFLDFLVGAFKRCLVSAATFVFFHASAYLSTAFCQIAYLAANASLHYLPKSCIALPNSTAALACLSASSFPRMPLCPGIQYMDTVVPQLHRICRECQISPIISCPDGYQGQ